MRDVFKRCGALLQAMQEAAATSFGPMFTSGAEGAKEHMDSLEAAMLRSGDALEAEFSAPEGFLAGMPCHLLISAGRQLLGDRTSEREALARVRGVVEHMARELEMIRQSADNTGACFHVSQFSSVSVRSLLGSELKSEVCLLSASD